MPLEIEAKLKLPDADALDALEWRLALIQATPVETLTELNIFLDNAEHELLRGDRGLRIRLEHIVPVDEHAALISRVVVTYKGARSPGDLKEREEREFECAEDATAECVAGVFSALGYVEQLRFEKRRRRFRHAGCTIELDHLSELGCDGRFVEIEGPDRETVMNVRDELQLTAFPLITTSYAAIVAHAREDGSSTLALRDQTA
jgi:predicted adenylyl cyclase CyaB